MPTRRDFLRTTAAAGGAILAGVTPALAAPRRAPKLDILVLGGTGFIGPHIVRAAVARGHRVSIFTRGRRDAELPSSVIRLVGDRNGQLQALEGKKWDAVIDDSATNPDWVKQSTELLKGNAGQYLFTSSTGVYYPYLTRGIDESGPVHTEAQNPQDGSEMYGVNKAKCEQLTTQAFGDGAIIVRPSFIVGPGDTTDRFPYWPVRLARGGEVLGPGRKEDPVQFIDVRDLADFMLRLIETKKSGAYNAAGPRKEMTVRPFLEQARDALKANVTFTWVDDYEFLAAHRITGLIPWAMLRGNNDGLMSIKNDKALAAGLTLRPLGVTVRDTLAWWPTVPEARRANPRFGMSAEQEAQALADWKARTK